MPAIRIDGKAFAAGLRECIAELVPDLPRQPALAVVLVGDDPASQVYVRNKIKQTEACGMRSIHHRLPEDATQAQVEDLVRQLNNDDDVDGILVQLPLPRGLDEKPVLDLISPEKDVDGLTEVSAGRLALGKEGLRPCTPTGCVLLAKDQLGDNLSGKTCVVVGRSILVGKPAAFLFLAEHCTVSIAHSRTRDLPGLCRTADILVAAVGQPQMIKGDWIKPGACVLDVGMNRIDAPETERGTRLVGDVAFDEAVEVAGSITPVPGGIGPMTIACLLRNTLIASARRQGLEDPDV